MFSQLTNAFWRLLCSAVVSWRIRLKFNETIFRETRFSEGSPFGVFWRRDYLAVIMPNYRFYTCSFFEVLYGEFPRNRCWLKVDNHNTPYIQRGRIPCRRDSIPLSPLWRRATYVCWQKNRGLKSGRSDFRISGAPLNPDNRNFQRTNKREAAQEIYFGTETKNCHFFDVR